MLNKKGYNNMLNVQTLQNKLAAGFKTMYVYIKRVNKNEIHEC